MVRHIGDVYIYSHDIRINVLQVNLLPVHTIYSRNINDIFTRDTKQGGTSEPGTCTYYIQSNKLYIVGGTSWYQPGGRL